MRLGAVLEALEGPRNEDVAKLVRLRCRASDGTEGWVTYKGAGNSVFFVVLVLFFCLEQNAKCKCERILKMPNVLQICFFLWKCLWVSHLFDLFKKGWCVASCRRFSPGNQGTTFLEPGSSVLVNKKKYPQQPRFSRGCSCTERPRVFQRSRWAKICVPSSHRDHWSLGCFQYIYSDVGWGWAHWSVPLTAGGEWWNWMFMIFVSVMCQFILAPLQLRTEFEKRLGLKFPSLTDFDGFLLTNVQLLLAVNIWKTKERWWCDTHQR